MKKVLLFGCCILVFLGTIPVVGCGGQTYNIAVANGLVKSFPRVNKGDVLKFYDGQGNKLTVNFVPLTPCREGKSTDTCTVNVDAGFYPYDCTGCEDPGVGVGGANPIEFGVLTTRDVTPKPALDGVYCDPAGNSANAVLETAAPGDRFQWVPSGQVSNWWVEVADGTCAGANNRFNKDHPICRVLGTANSQKYTVHVEPCGTVETKNGDLRIVRATP